VHQDRVPVTGETEEFGQLGPRHIPAGGLVGEHPVKDQALELPPFVLIQGADPYVPDSLAPYVSGWNGANGS
jgi:hypothetical protein